MSPCSTINITLHDAVVLLSRKITHATDRQIVDMLYDLVGHDHLCNFKIVPEYVENDDRNYKDGDLG